MAMEMFFVVEVLLYFLVSATGLAVNTHLSINLIAKYQGSSEFSKLCLAKTIPNVLVCATYLFWCTPLSAFKIPNDELPIILNVFIGQVNIAGTYVLRPGIQMFLAINIWFSITFPLKKLKFRSSLITLISIVFVIIPTIAYVVRRMIPLICGLSYKPQLLIWTSDSTECANYYGKLSTNAVMVMCIISSCFTVATFLKLSCFEKGNGLSSQTMLKRRRRRIRFFIQSVCQDGLHVLDLISWRYISVLNPAPWFQFTTSKLPLLLLHVLDGFVMSYFRPELYPEFMKRKKSISIMVTNQSNSPN